MKVGKDTVSDYQKELLEEASQRRNLRFFYDAFKQVLDDDDIQSDRETVHPEWCKLFQRRRSSLQKVLPSRHFKELDNFFLKMSAVDPGICELDPSDGRICFLLGAGASKPRPSNIPTVKELLPDMLARARRLDREDVTKLADFCEESKIRNIEDLLTAAELATFSSRNPNVLRVVEFLLYRGLVPEERELCRARHNIELSSAAFLQETLQVLFSLLSSTMLPAKPNAAHKAIVKYVQQHSEAHIITTNYDCCIDLAFLDKNIDFSYGLKFSNRHPTNGNKKRGIGLTKLHGSLNWFYCETCQDLQLIDIKATVVDYLEDKRPYPVIAVCRVCGGQCRPLLVPPLAMKFDMAPPLTRLFEQANVAFNNANIIVVVGFSFAEADLYLSRMLNKSMQTSREQRLLIIDPDLSVAEKIQRKFEASILDFDPNRVLGIRGDCSKMLPKFLSGEMVRNVDVRACEPTVEVASK